MRCPSREIRKLPDLGVIECAKSVPGPNEDLQALVGSKINQGSPRRQHRASHG